MHFHLRAAQRPPAALSDVFWGRRVLLRVPRDVPWRLHADVTPLMGAVGGFAPWAEFAGV